MVTKKETEPNLAAAVQSGDSRRALLGIRDYIVNELDGHRCSKCLTSQLKSGDQATLVLRLQQVLKELEETKPVEKAPTGGNVRSLDSIRGNRDAVAAAADGERELGTKKAPRRQGGPRRRGVST
jgi:hypothetical protein